MLADRAAALLFYVAAAAAVITVTAWLIVEQPDQAVVWSAALFAALNVHSGELIWETKDRNPSVDFIAFLEHLDQATPPDLTVHLVLDNGASHTSKQTRAWLEDPGRAERFRVHHTPTHASWLNQVELFFSILGRRLLRRESSDQCPTRGQDHWIHHSLQPESETLPMDLRRQTPQNRLSVTDLRA